MTERTPLRVLVAAMAALALLSGAFSAAAARADDAANEAETVLVRMTTSMGDIVIELNKAKAPITVENFLAYTDSGHYDGTIFHRVIANFMIQGGGFDANMRQKPTRPPIENEWRNGLKNDRGTIAMARTNHPDSATAQFFINVADNPSLDAARPETGGAGYAVFGRVVDGMDVVDRIRRVPTAARGMQADVPVEPVIIEKVRRIENAAD